MHPISLLGSGLGRIRGISRSSLWNSWKAIRQELRNASVRDVVDFLEYDVDPDKWINSLLRQIESGRYEPSTLLRFTLGKSLGFSRTMTLPSVPDLVLYRAIVDCFYSKAKRKQHQHSHVEEALRGLVVPPRMVGLLFFLLERLSIRQDYSGSHGISLPVDEFDCSRNLAHMVLFSHDDTMVRLVGENAYIRWMDDQIIGVQSG
jgi:hypothetical protein